jgi:DNA-binding transcriptional ArsR family regulator
VSRTPRPLEKRDAISALSALAHETRLDVFRLLVRAGERGLPAGEIARELDVPAATLSFHLKELKNAGAVAVERDGRSLIYRAHFDTMNRLVAFLMQNCCQGVRRR